jgi:hypothetical protein
MSIEVFINDVSTYSLQDYNIAYVKFDKKSLNLSITNSGIQGELKSINMGYSLNEYEYVQDRLLKLSDTSDFLYIDTDDFLLCLRKHNITSIISSFELLTVKTYDHEFSGRIKGFIENGESQMFIAQKYALELIDELNQD